MKGGFGMSRGDLDRANEINQQGADGAGDAIYRWMRWETETSSDVQD